MGLAQFGQAREQPLGAEQRQHPQMQPQHLAVLNLSFDRRRKLVKPQADRVVEGMAIVGQPHRLMLAREQPLADEFLKRGDPARQRRGAEPELVGRSARAAEADNPHERFDRAEGRKAADGQGA